MAYRCKVDSGYTYTMIFASRGCEKLLGICQEELLRHPTNIIELLTLEEDLAGWRRTLEEALAAKRSYELYYRIRLASGEEKWLWDQGEGLYDERGRCRFLEGIIMDVTAQKTREQNLKRENRRLRPSAPESEGFGGLVGRSKSMREIYGLLRKAAQCDTNVLLYGETGVGKDVAARTIHDLSGLKGRYIPVNCAAIPEQLLESEFFGHVKGAFSGAATSRMGYLAAADKGTLFLDEIADLPLHLQVKLLRALESKTYTPVGSNETRSSDFRLISATNRNLDEMVRQKSLRADFFYRIHVLTIVLPPLRERKGDIPLLVRAYSRRKGVADPLPADILALFEAAPWPGNVRELQNALERYWTFGPAGISMETACPDIFSASGQKGAGSAGGPPVMPFPPPPVRAGSTAVARGERERGRAKDGSPLPPGDGPAQPDGSRPSALSSARDNTEKQRILAALEQCGWKKGKSAEILGITIRTLQRKLKKYSLRRPAPSAH
jgi:PAS domain S-box-containing protein